MNWTRIPHIPSMITVATIPATTAPPTMNRSARLFDDPNLVVLRPPPSPLNPAQNLDLHRLMTLKLDLRSHASRDIPLKQDGRRRTSTSLPPRLFNLPPEETRERLAA